MEPIKLAPVQAPTECLATPLSSPNKSNKQSIGGHLFQIKKRTVGLGLLVVEKLTHFHQSRQNNTKIKPATEVINGPSRYTNYGTFQLTGSQLESKFDTDRSVYKLYEESSSANGLDDTQYEHTDFKAKVAKTINETNLRMPKTQGKTIWSITAPNKADTTKH